MTTSAYNPAPRSSITIPLPPGKRSSCRTGGGLRISNALKSIRLARKDFQASGTPTSATSCPATSSMTINWGSFLPVARDTLVEAGIPMRVMKTAAAIVDAVRYAGGISDEASAQARTVATDPHVPGPGLIRPTPKKVATRVAQRRAGAGDKEGGGGASGAEAPCAEGAGLRPSITFIGVVIRDSIFSVAQR